MSWKRIRPIVLGVARREESLFVAEHYDAVDDDRFYRPLGGGIEFGETSTEALRREFREELDVEIEVTTFLGTIENVFTFDGTDGHEVVFVYGITLPETFSETLPVEVQEDDGTTFTADWRPLSTFTEAEESLYPEGLVSILTTDTTHVCPSD